MCPYLSFAKPDFATRSPPFGNLVVQLILYSLLVSDRLRLCRHDFDSVTFSKTVISAPSQLPQQLRINSVWFPAFRTLVDGFVLAV